MAFARVAGGRLLTLGAHNGTRSSARAWRGLTAFSTSSPARGALDSVADSGSGSGSSDKLWWLHNNLDNPTTAKMGRAMADLQPILAGIDAGTDDVGDCCTSDRRYAPLLFACAVSLTHPARGLADPANPGKSSGFGT